MKSTYGVLASILLIALCNVSMAQRSMTCRIGGCPQGALELREQFSSWDFDFRDDGLQPLTVFDEPLRLLGILKGDEQVESLYISLSKKDCSEARNPIGTFYCKGETGYAGLRIRTDQSWDDKTSSALYRWRDIQIPIRMEIHPNPVSGDVFDYDWDVYLGHDDQNAWAKVLLRDCTFREAIR